MVNSKPQPSACVISIGTELITGQTIDTNSAWISETLTRHGVRVESHQTVGDDPSILTQTIRQAHSLHELVVITGGLGPTEDDITRECVAEALGVNLKENSEAMQQILDFFFRIGKVMPESNRKQAMLPDKCLLVKNPRGTAPGIHFADNRGDKTHHIFALPGVPLEMKAMFDEVLAVVADCQTHFSVVGQLITFGTHEALLGDTLADLMQRGRNPSVGTTASHAVITIRVIASGATAAEAEMLLSQDLEEIRGRVGNAVFSEGGGSLQGSVAGLLSERRLSLSTAESCTGGIIAGRLTDIPGSSRWFREGFVTYANEAKMARLGVPADMLEAHGAVSEPVAAAMAEGARSATGSSFSLSVTGIAGPGGGSAEKPVGLVYVGLAEAGATRVTRLAFGDHLTRGEIRDRTAKTALNLLRLRLLG